MLVRTLIGAGCAAAVVACSSPPKPPTVDDSMKRPVNVSEAVNLQMCRTELSAAKIVLNESLVGHAFAAQAAAVRPEPVQPVPADANQVFVISFPVASADLNLSAAEKAHLAEQARGAKLIVIRGRTDALTDSMVETQLAKRRAQAAYSYLTGQVGLPPDGIRVSWQGAGDSLRQGELLPSDRPSDRRVEIEMYKAKPVVQVLTAMRS